MLHKKLFACLTYGVKVYNSDVRWVYERFGNGIYIYILFTANART